MDELKTFKDFAGVLKGYDNINTVPMSGGYPDRYEFMKALILKAKINSEEVRLSAPDMFQPLCRLDKEGNIYIQVLGVVIERDNARLGTYQTFTIHPDWSVSRGTRPYKVQKEKF